jgi:hypothetical protein
MIPTATAISRTATTPLTTADHNSVFTGSSPMKLIAIPISVATTIVPYNARASSVCWSSPMLME